MTEPDPPSVEEVFAGALDREPAERKDWLDAVTAGRPEIRAMVDRLLSVQDEAGRFFGDLDVGPGFMDDDGRSGSGAGDPAPVGGTIGPWRITREIAAGGMGTVYEAERTDGSFRQSAALKLIHPELAGPGLLARFRRERQLLADLEHPAIARLIDGGSTEAGQPWLAMEFVKGRPIDVWCREEKPSVDTVLHVFLEVIDAVRYAHRNLVIHRDLKPGNILVTDEGRVKLLDFGIAKVIAAEGPGAGAGATLTRFQAYTPRYASPEQVRGARITTATDVYSLGVVLHELLTGRPPFPLEGLSPLEIERAMTRREPTRPSRAVLDRDASSTLDDRAARKLSRRLSGDLDTILLKALQVDPERRYAGAEDLAADLRRHLAGETVNARPDTFGYRVSRFIRRNPALSAAVLGAVSILAVALAITSLALRETARQREEARHQAYIGSLAAAEAAIVQNNIGEARRHLDRAPEDLRGWEWSHLVNRTDRSIDRWTAHAKGITGLAPAADGSTVVSASIDSTVALWNPDSREMIRRWGPFASEVESAVPVPGRPFVVAGLNDGSVVLLPIDPALPPSPFFRGNGWARIAVSPDGSRFAAGFLDGTVRVWRTDGGDSLAVWKAHENFALPAWSKTGDRIVTGGGEGALRSWDAGDYSLRWETRAHEKRVYAIDTSADGAGIATGSMDRTAAVWDAVTGRELHRFREHTATVGPVLFLGIAGEMLTAGAEGRLLRWKIGEPGILAEFRGHSADVVGGTVIRGGSRILTGDWGGVIRAWSPATEDVKVRSVPGIGTIIPRARALAFRPGTGAAGRLDNGLDAHVDDDPDVPWLACASNVDEFGAWGGRALRTVRGFQANSARRLAWTPDGRHILSAYFRSGVEIFDAATRVRVGRQVTGSDPEFALAVDPAGRWFVTAGADSVIRVWKLPAVFPADVPFDRADSLFSDTLAVAVARLEGHRGPVLDLDVSPAGDRLVSCGADSTIRVWDTGTWNLLGEMPRGKGPVTNGSFSPDGRLFVSVDAAGGFKVDDIATGRSRWTQHREGHPMADALFTRDGRRVVAGGADQVVSFFDAVTGMAIVDLHGHSTRVSVLALSEDGKTLASGSWDGTVRLWDGGP